MQKVILFTLLCNTLAEIYNEKASDAYKHDTISSTFVFPYYIVANKDAPQTFKVTRALNSEIVFQVLPSQKPFFLRTILGKMNLTRFVFSFSETGAQLTIRFSWPNTTPKKVVIVSKVVTPASTEKLQKHAKQNAVFIQPMTLDDIDTLINQRDPMTKYMTMSARFIVDLIGKKTPLFKPISQNSNVWVFLSLPTIMNADILNKLSELQQKMESAD